MTDEFDVPGLYDRPKGPHGWIQWKGTNVCMDVHCGCGHHGHVDDEFAYFYLCRCGRGYAIGGTVTLYPLTPEQVASVAARDGFVKDESDE